METVTLAVLFLYGYAASCTGGSVDQVWPLTLACLKVAEASLTDAPLASDFWKKAVERTGETWTEMVSMEAEVLANSGCSLLASQRRWSAVHERSENMVSAMLQDIDIAFSTPVVEARVGIDAERHWKMHRDEITELYQTHKLSSVMEIMEQKHGFKASLRGYRQRLADWDVKKRWVSGPRREGSFDFVEAEFGHQIEGG